MPSSKSSSLAKDVAKVATGTVIAQLITVAISPILSRLYSPENFGILGLYLSVLAILTMNATLRYHQAIVLPEKDEDAASIVGVSFLALFGIVGVLTLLSVFFHAPLARWFSLESVSFVFWMIPLGVLFGGINLILKNWHIRFRSYSTSASGEAAQSLGNSGGQLGLGYAYLASSFSLLSANLMGHIASLGIYAGTLPYKRKLLKRSLFSFTAMKTQAIRYKKFFQFSTLAGIVNKLSWELPSFLLLYFFEPAILGYYVFGHRLLRLPVSLIGNSIGQVFFERAAKAFLVGNLPTLTELVIHRLVQIGFFPFFVLIFIGEPLFAWVFGNEWSVAGFYTQILAIYTFFWFMSGPISTVFAVTDNQDKVLHIQIILLTLKGIGLTIGGLLGSPVVAMIGLSISGVLGYGYLMKVISQITELSIGFFWKELRFQILPMSVFTGGFFLLTSFSELVMIGYGILACILYYFYLFHKEPEMKQLLSNIHS